MVCIEATGAITVRGEINANGNNGAEGRDGGGSGGSIRIACRTLDGEGWLRAVGGLAAGGFTGVGSGGGGRIAVDVNAAEQALVSGTVPQITTARGENHQVGTPGTIYTSDPDKLLPETLDGMVAAEYYTGTTAEWTPGSLTVKNRAISFQTPGITINSPGNVTLLSSLSLPAYTTLKCANLLLTNSAYLRVYAGVTNGSWPNYAARVCVNGAIDVHSNCTIYADSATYRQHSPPDGGPVRFETQHLTIHAWGAFNADGLGYSGATNYNVTGDRGFGLGGGASAYRGYGGGYGGTGNGAGGGYGGTYGTANAPAAVGSGGGSGYQANEVPNSRSGGGCIWIRATGNLTVNGAISASAGVPGGQGGGGSGGGVFIVCKTVQGTAGINAGGGNSGGGYGGGGGRIAVWYNTTPAQLDAYLLNGAGAITTDPPPNYGLDKLSVTGGTGYNSGNGQSGTKSFYSIPPPKGTVIMMR
jgi:hypothetical protein